MVIQMAKEEAKWSEGNDMPVGNSATKLNS